MTEERIADLPAIKVTIGDSWKLEPSDAFVVEWKEAPDEGLRDWLVAYSQGRAIPGLVADGTEFQRRVWLAMRQIPWGETVTYGALAAEIGMPQAAQAVGQACGANPRPLLIPCHRVKAADGLGGFAFGEEVKKRLLAFEMHSH